MMSILGIISEREAWQYQKSISQHWEPFFAFHPPIPDDAQDKVRLSFESQNCLHFKIISGEN